MVYYHTLSDRNHVSSSSVCPHKQQYYYPATHPKDKLNVSSEKGW